ncbi:MAG: LysR substrate-binding domain-containing protein [Burkholderiaceae bacterium]
MLPRSRATLRQLEAFCAVAFAGSVSAAARRLSRTQSAVSLALQELETALGAKLFERAGRGLRQTEAARRLLPKAMELIDRAAELPALARDADDSPQHLAIGASRTIGPFVIPDLLAGFVEQQRISIELVIENTEALAARLRDLNLDVAFIEGDVLEPGLSLQPWLKDEICLFARVGHPAPTALAQGRWALRERGSGTRETFLRAMRPLLGPPVIALEVNDAQALKRLVSNSDWFGCLSRRAVADEFADGSLIDVTPRSPSLRRALTRSFWIATHPQRYQSAATRALIAHATERRGTRTRAGAG